MIWMKMMDYSSARQYSHEARRRLSEGVRTPHLFSWGACPDVRATAAAL